MENRQFVGISVMGQYLRHAIEKRIPLLMVGSPGQGKTAVALQTGVEMGYDVIVLHPAVWDPTDVKGFPCVIHNNGSSEAEFVPFGDFKEVINATSDTVVFLDDLGQAPISVQAALMQVVGARSINGHRIPDCVTFIAASNFKKDKAGTFGIIQPLQSRLVTLFLKTSANEWIDYARRRGLDDRLVGFVQSDPSVIEEPKRDDKLEFDGYCCPRSLELASRLIEGAPEDMFTALLAGVIGYANAAAFQGFCQVYNRMPDIEDVIADPHGVELPDEAYLRSLCAASWGRRVEVETMPQLSIAAKRLGPEYETLFMTALASNGGQDGNKGARLRKTPEYGDWCKRCA